MERGNAGDKSDSSADSRWASASFMAASSAANRRVGFRARARHHELLERRNASVPRLVGQVAPKATGHATRDEGIVARRYKMSEHISTHVRRDTGDDKVHDGFRRRLDFKQRVRQQIARVHGPVLVLGVHLRRTEFPEWNDSVRRRFRRSETTRLHLRR
ncbi:hypothetical protein PsorP6_002030 [Peronosclerospora sorghi]|uniref:Uncharacterized protein n=1 Tax=Peronosclerospora sorghi TaxID=230839 RepID=A0ACC0WWK3_9STRA|nr:hypothetical protein PsorP6_002030 [Peronosclerospora sorghi]